MTQQPNEPTPGIYTDEAPPKPKRGHEYASDYDHASPAQHSARGLDEGKLKGGLVLIGLGTYFLLQRLVPDFDFNWWALFIFVPGVYILTRLAFAKWFEGSIPSELREKGFGGLMLTLVGSMFLFELDWGTFWPLFLIVPGLAILLGWKD